jgi:hypothetical protein
MNGFSSALYVLTWGKSEHNPAVGRSSHVPTQRYMLTCRVNVAEQTLRFAIYINIPPTRRSEKTIQRSRALVSHVGDITAIPCPLFDAQPLPSLDDLHSLTAVP